MNDEKLKTKLVNEYAGKGKKFIDEKLGEVKNKLDKFVNAIDEKGAITETGDAVFGATPSEAMAKSAELSVEYAALKEVKNSLNRSEKYKKLSEENDEGDVLSPTNELDAKLFAASFAKSFVKPLNATDAFKEAVAEGKINANYDASHKKTSAKLGANDEESFKILLNTFEHRQPGASTGSYESELLRTGRVQLQPIVQQDMLDILPRVQLGVNGFKYMEEKTITNANTGGAVAGRQEGGRVAEQTLEYVERLVTLKNAGVRIPITDEVSNDEPFLLALITGRLENLMRKYTANQVMNGTGAGTQFQGIFSRVTAAQVNATNNDDGFTSASLGNSATYGSEAQNAYPGNIPAYKVSSPTDGKNAIVDLYKASTHIEDVGGETADYAVLKSGTLAAIYTAQDGNNNFIFPQNGFNTGLVPLLGIPYVKDSTLPNNRALVGSFANNCALGVAGGLSAGIGYDGQDFSQFQRTMRMGFRGNLAVYNQNAFVVLYNIVT